MLREVKDGPEGSRLRTDRKGGGWATEGPTWHRPRVVGLPGTSLGKN